MLYLDCFLGGVRNAAARFCRFHGSMTSYSPIRNAQLTFLTAYFRLRQPMMTSTLQETPSPVMQLAQLDRRIARVLELAVVLVTESRNIFICCVTITTLSFCILLYRRSSQR